MSALVALAASFGLGFLPTVTNVSNPQTWWSGQSWDLFAICLIIPATLLLISIPLRKYMVAYRVCAGLFVCVMASVLVMQMSAIGKIQSDVNSDGTVSISSYLLAACTVITLIIGLAMLFWRNQDRDSEPAVLPDA